MLKDPGLAGSGKARQVHLRAGFGYPITGRVARPPELPQSRDVWGMSRRRDNAHLWPRHMEVMAERLQRGPAAMRPHTNQKQWRGN